MGDKCKYATTSPDYLAYPCGTADCDYCNNQKLPQGDLVKEPLVGVLMGSENDWDTMQHCLTALHRLDIGYEKKIVSAHRTPQLMFDYASTAQQRGLEVLIAGAGGAAHLPGMVAALTVLPVIGVPIETKTLHGIDSLLSIAQMPAGCPVATMAIGTAGAVNAGYLAARILGNSHGWVREAYRKYQEEVAQKIIASHKEFCQ